MLMESPSEKLSGHHRNIFRVWFSIFFFSVYPLQNQIKDTKALVLVCKTKNAEDVSVEKPVLRWLPTISLPPFTYLITHLQHRVGGLPVPMKTLLWLQCTAAEKPVNLERWQHLYVTHRVRDPWGTAEFRTATEAERNLPRQVSFRCEGKKTGMTLPIKSDLASQLL